jgi:hypothetical protein
MRANSAILDSGMRAVPEPEGIQTGGSPCGAGPGGEAAGWTARARGRRSDRPEGSSDCCRRLVAVGLRGGEFRTRMRVWKLACVGFYGRVLVFV